MRWLRKFEHKGIIATLYFQKQWPRRGWGPWRVPCRLKNSSMGTIQRRRNCREEPVKKIHPSVLCHWFALHYSQIKKCYQKRKQNKIVSPDLSGAEIGKLRSSTNRWRCPSPREALSDATLATLCFYKPGRLQVGRILSGLSCPTSPDQICKGIEMDDKQWPYNNM